MKTDRLLAELLYLMQHGRVTARQLGERFEVSPRTVLRDMESLCMAGVPIISYEGATGGFALQEDYRITGSFADKNDAALIITALQALSTAITDEGLQRTIDKYRALHKAESELHIDLSALAEDKRTQRNLTALRRAIAGRHAVRILYTNTAGETAEHTVEPMELHYRWYAWYLLAYSRKKQAVLTYKLVRMDRVTETAEPVCDHTDAAPPADDRPIVHLLIRCKERARVPLIEYLHAQPQQQLENGDWLLQVTIPEQERFWRGALLSLGSDAEILSPPEVIEEFRQLAQGALDLYDKK